MGALAAERDWLLAATGGRVHDFYAAIGVPLPDRGAAEASVRCFANPVAHKREDRNPSCSVNLLTGLWCCLGCGQSGNAYGAALAVGCSEQRARELARRHGLFLEAASKEQKPREPKPKLPTETQLRKWREALLGSPRVVARLGDVKGWMPAALVRCGLGWDGERVTFPIRAKNLKLVGLVRYLPGGSPKSLAVPGSKRGLFPAPEVLSRRRALFVVEGEPDAVSVRSCGHQAVAIPGVGGWRPEFAQRLAGFRLVMLADCDSQGRELALRVSATLPSVRVVDVEPGRDDGFDVGDLVVEASREGGVWQMGRVLDSIARAA